MGSNRDHTADQTGLRPGVSARLCAAALALSVSFVGGASAKSLRDEPSIDNKMLGVAIAIEISDECSTISARKLKGLSFLWGLKSQAADLGYSDAEIRSYVESDTEKKRIRARGEAYVRSAGYDPKSTQDLCKLGTQEIAQKSFIGSFLRGKI